MATVEDLIDDARADIISENAYTNAVALKDLNKIIHNFENMIVSFVDEDFFHRVSYTDLKISQVQYILPLSTSAIGGLKKINVISAKYENDSIKIESYVSGTKTITLSNSWSDLVVGTTVKFYDMQGKLLLEDEVATITVEGLVFTLVTGLDSLTNGNLLLTKDVLGEYIPMRETIIAQNGQGERYMRENELQAYPKFRVAGNGIFVYPVLAEEEYVTNGLRIEYIADLPDVALTTLQSDIGIPWQYLDVIEMGLQRRIFKRRKMFNEANIAKADYESLRDEALSMLTNRVIEEGVEVLPDVTYLE